MAKSPKFQPRLPPPKGRGVPVSLTAQGMHGDSPVYSFAMELAQADPPERQYTADSVVLAIKEDIVHLAFAQSKLDDSGLRSMLDVCMPIDHAWNYARSLRALLPPPANTGLKSPVSIGREPDEVVAVTATLGLMVAAHYEATADFYYIAARDHNKVVSASTTHINVEPVVRINMSAAVARGLIEPLIELIRPSAERFNLPQ